MNVDLERVSSLKNMTQTHDEIDAHSWLLLNTLNCPHFILIDAIIWSNNPIQVIEMGKCIEYIAFSTGKFQFYIKFSVDSSLSQL